MKFTPTEFKFLPLGKVSRLLTFIGIGLTLSVITNPLCGQIVSVEAADPNQSFSVDDQIFIAIHFSATATVTVSAGIPSLKLALADGRTVEARYLSGSGSTILTFIYQVRNGDHTPKLDYPDTDALILNGGVITNNQGANIDRTLPTPGTENSLGNSLVSIIDTTIPAILDSYSSGNLSERVRIPQFRDPCFFSDSGFIFLVFDEGVFRPNGDPLLQSDFSLSGDNLDIVISCSNGIRNEEGGALVGGESVIRLKYELQFGSENSEIEVTLANDIRDSANNILAAGTKLAELDIDQFWAYELNLQDLSRRSPVDISLVLGQGPYDDSTDLDHNHLCEGNRGTQCTDPGPDYLTNFYFLISEFPAPYQEASCYGKGINEIVSTWELFIDPLDGGDPINGTLSWSKITSPPPSSVSECLPPNSNFPYASIPTSDYNSDFVFQLQPLDSNNPLSAPVNMKDMNSTSPLLVSERTGFEIVYGPKQIVDSESPTITACPPDDTLFTNTNQCLTALPDYTSLVTASDDFDSELSIAQIPKPQSTLGSGMHLVEIVVEDASRNAAFCYFSVTIRDNQDPEITCPENISLENETGMAGATVTYSEPMESDNCPGTTMSLVNGIGNGMFFPIGSTTETYEITDMNGNTDLCSFSVTVTDGESPTVICQDFTALLTEENNTRIHPEQLYSMASDNDAIDRFEISQESISCDDFPETSVVLTVVDKAGNDAECRSKVSIGYETPQSVTVDVHRGWNMVGIPIFTCEEPGDFFQQSLFSKIWAFDSEMGMVQIKDFQFHLGYLTYFNQAPDQSLDSITVNGQRLSNEVNTIQLQNGWNLISPVRDLENFFVSEISGPIWFWDRRHYIALPNNGTENLQSGRGYWIHSLKNQEIP